MCDALSHVACVFVITEGINFDRKNHQGNRLFQNSSREEKIHDQL